MITCPNCGRENVDTVRLCSFCDYELHPVGFEHSPEAEETVASGDLTTQPEGTPAEVSGADASDALRSLFANEEVEGQDDQQEPAVEAPAEAPDWLNELTPPAEQPPATASDDLPDWLSEGPAGAGSGAQPQADDVPDWLSDAAPDAGPTPDEGELPDWLSESPVAQPAQGSSEAEAPAPATPIEPAAPADDQDMPDWLQEGLAAAEAPLTPLQPDRPDTEEASGDWLDEVLGTESANLESAVEAPVDEPISDVAEAGDADVPDWLADLAPADAPVPAVPDTPSEQPVPPAAATDATDDDTPDWLAGIGTPTPVPDAPSEQPVPPAAATDATDDDMPDWLAGIKPGEAPATTGTDKDVTEDVPAGEAGKSGLLAASAALTGDDASLTGEDMPDWLAALQPGGAEASGESPFDDSLFSWLDEAVDEEDEDEAPAELAADEISDEDEVSTAEPIDLEQAELPEWLRAASPTEEGGVAVEMQPEIVAPPPLPVSDEAVPESMEMLRAASIAGVLDPELEVREEGTGPLKGVVGAVAAEPIFEDVAGLMPSTSAEMQVDSAQVSLLQALLGRESVPVVLREAVSSMPRAIGRYVAYLLLVAAITMPIVVGITPFEEPASIGEPAADSVRSLARLDASSSVLLAFEYDPSQVGEMDIQAEALLNYFIEREVSLYAISSQPTGPALAQRLLEQATDGRDYEYGEDYFNLGYVSGKAAGVNSLVIGGVEGAVSPLAFDYQGAPTDLESTTLSALGIDMIVVLAGRAESVRIWVEQAGNPSGIPMVVAIGAGAEPSVLPYYHQGRQVQGIISGLSGATGFTLATAQGADLPESLVGRWNAQVAGALAAALVILAGIAWQAVAAIRRQQELG